MYNVILSGVFSSIFFGFMVFYSRMQEFSKDTNCSLSKEEQFESAKYDALFLVKLIALVHGLIALVFFFVT